MPNRITDPPALDQALGDVRDNAEAVLNLFTSPKSDWAENNEENIKYIGNKPHLYSEVSAEGNPISIECGNVQNAQHTVISMEPIQDLHGYDYPWPAGGGNNLFDVSTVPNENKFINSNNGNTETSSSGNDWRYSDYIKVNSGDNLYCGWSAGTTSTAGIAFYDVNYDYVSGVSNVNITGTNNIITVPNDAVYIRISFNISSLNPNWQTTVYLTINSNPHEWSPYSNICPISGRTGVELTVKDGDNVTTQNIVIPFGETIYGGSLDVESGVLTINRIMEINANSGWIMSSIYQGLFIRLDTSGYDSTIKPLSNRYKSVNFSSSSMQAYNKGDKTIGLGTENNRIYIRDDLYENEQDFMMAISDIQIVYTLKTPTTIQLPKNVVHLLAGINTLLTDGDGINLTYLNDIYSITDLADEAVALFANIASTENTSTASKAYAQGDYMIFQGSFCKVTSAIASGGTITIGTNVTKTTLGAEIKAALS